MCSAVVGGAGLWSRSAGREGGGMSVVRESLGVWNLEGEGKNVLPLEFNT